MPLSPAPRSCLAGRERPELLSRLAPVNPLGSGTRDVPARSGSECNRRLGEGSGTSRLSEPLRPGTGRAPMTLRLYARAGCWHNSRTLAYEIFPDIAARHLPPDARRVRLHSSAIIASGAR